MTIDISKDIKKYIPIFQQAKEQNINEAETSLRIGKFLEDVLGYDIFQDITKEHSIKDKYVDYAIKVNGKVIFFVEIKQSGTELKERHIDQASNYAANAGVKWVVLTNGIAWQMYHLTFDEGIQSDLIWQANILENDIQDASLKISLIHKKNIIKGELDEYYTKAIALSPKSIIQSIFHEDTLQTIRRQLRKENGVSVDEQDVINGIKKMLSAETWEAIGDVKIKRKRKAAKPKEEVKTQITIEQSATEQPISETLAPDQKEGL